MDREQIEKMTAEELRLAIAKAKGWKEVYGKMYESTPMEHVYWTRPDGNRTLYPDDWAGYISAAWDLVEEMGHMRWSITIENMPSKPQEVVCRAFMPFIPGRINGYGETAPLAICRCWLAWKREAK